MRLPCTNTDDDEDDDEEEDEGSDMEADNDDADLIDDQGPPFSLRGYEDGLDQIEFQQFIRGGKPIIIHS